jgi:hypothetical protein
LLAEVAFQSRDPAPAALSIDGDGQGVEPDDR